MKILVLGRFDYNTTKLNGQTVKTRNVHQLLSERSTGVKAFDTQVLKQKKTAVFSMLSEFCKADKVFYLPAHGNLTYLFPLFFILSLLCKTELYYIQIGGWLHKLLKNKPIHAYFMSKINQVFAETISMKEMLEKDFGMKNVTLLNNFRLDEYPFSPTHEQGKLRCTFAARIMKKKGLDMIFALAEYIEHNGFNILIDFYGPVAEDDHDYFFNHVEKHASITYKGILQPKEIIPTLQKYDLMLLPTHYYTEGFPGSILEAYISGIPVIVTEWQYAHEFVPNEKVGFIIPFKNGQEQFNEKTEFLLNHPEELFAMKENAYDWSQCFLADNIWKTICEKAHLNTCKYNLRINTEHTKAL